MSASQQPWFHGFFVILAIVALILASGCASQHATTHVSSPDESMLKPATTALDKALSAHANKFAPEIVTSARQRITLARDILITAAQEGRAVTADEQDHIDTLVRQAKLDARAALVKTQAEAVKYQIDRLSQANRDAAAQAGHTSSSGMGPSTGNNTHGNDQANPQATLGGM